MALLRAGYGIRKAADGDSWLLELGCQVVLTPALGGRPSGLTGNLNCLCEGQ